MLTTTQIRQKFLDYFAKHDHTVVPSSSLIPGNDPTLLFTNAGMVQFKDVFIGQDKRPYVRATSSQRCVRAGGKHNDLENVGYTARHHTFFEMLGNFSFGDYFKKEAIGFAWEFLTVELKLPKEKLWVTVFQEDDEAYDIWVKDIKFDPTRISRCGEKDNFWMMGDTGPCGPCSEIFYDHGDDIFGGPPGTPDADGDRYIEVWNMVFMQYERFADGSQKLLPKPSVDTGMGLERITAVLQHVHNNYEIDLFQSLIKAIAKLAHVTDLQNKALRVIADHIRACSFLIVDGVIPSNEGRGYVLRRIMRRALRYGNKLGLTDTFFYKLVSNLAEVMGDQYPELRTKQTYIEKVIKQEEEQFATTLDKGLKILDQAIAQLKNNIIPGEIVFKLYDTYGFPMDLTGDIARERNLELDIQGFEQAMTAQRNQSKQASQFGLDYTQQLKVDQQTQFCGYEKLQENRAIITALFKGNQPVNTLNADEQGFVVLDRTPFYAESGGQVGDQGLLSSNNNSFEVNDTTKAGQAHIHHGVVRVGSLSVGDVVTAEVKSSEREATRRNHSATHLLHAALRKILGEHVQQKGSLVNAERLRFDFSHTTPLGNDEWQAIEKLVNEKIRDNLLVETKLMSADEAKKSGAMALFGEKYGDEVRVLAMGDFSIELCGGTHVNRTGDIGAFMLVEEAGIAAGVRRIEAITGTAVIEWLQTQRTKNQQLALSLKTKEDAKQLDMITELQTSVKTLHKQLESFAAQNTAKVLLNQAQDINGVKVLVAECAIDAGLLRNLANDLKQALPKSVLVLAVKETSKASVIASVTDNLTDKIKANEIIKLISDIIDARGGGKADMAQAGGTKPEKWDEAVQLVKQYIANKL